MEGDRWVTVRVSVELLEQMSKGDGWSPPVQVRIDETPGIGTGYEMTARTVPATAATAADTDGPTY